MRKEMVFILKRFFAFAHLAEPHPRWFLFVSTPIDFQVVTAAPQFGITLRWYKCHKIYIFTHVGKYWSFHFSLVCVSIHHYFFENNAESYWDATALMLLKLNIIVYWSEMLLRRFKLEIARVTPLSNFGVKIKLFFHTNTTTLGWLYFRGIFWCKTFSSSRRVKWVKGVEVISDV